MKKFIHRVQDIGNKAAQIKAAIESVPPKVAEMRQAVASTAGQLHQLRSEVQANVTGLRADTEDKLVETLRELDCSADTFREAGYELYDVEMELGLPQRLIVELEKVEDVSHSRVRSLAAANEANQATHAILLALLKAEELANRVDLTNLTYHRLMVYVGPLPVVRLCWRANTLEELPPALPSPPPLSTAPASPLPTSTAFSSSSIFGSSSFFEKRSTPSATSTPSPDVNPVSTSAPSPQESMATPISSEPIDPLARFKKMPDLSKKQR